MLLWIKEHRPEDRKPDSFAFDTFHEASRFIADRYLKREYPFGRSVRSSDRESIAANYLSGFLTWRPSDVEQGIDDEWRAALRGMKSATEAAEEEDDSQHAGAAAANGETSGDPSTGGKSSVRYDRDGQAPNNSANANARMLDTMVKRPESKFWSARQWADALGYRSASTIKETLAWRELAKLRQNRKAEAGLDHAERHVGRRKG